MENEASYDQRGYFRMEFGEKYDEGYVTYSDGILTIVLPNDLKIDKTDNLRINISGSQTTSAKSITVSVGSGYVINGDLTVNGSASITGDCAVSGNLKVGGNVAAGGDVIVNNISLSTHRHYCDAYDGITSDPFCYLSI